MADVFTSVTVYPQSPAVTLVEWTLHPDFRLTGSYAFQLQFSRSPSPDADDQWVDVGTAVVAPSTAMSALDTAPRSAAGTHTRNSFYRVRLTNGDSEVYYSHAEPNWGGLSRSDRLLVRELYRQECLRLDKKVGTPGFLFHARQHGPRAPLDHNSTDFVTGLPLNTESVAPVGTRFDGGYWAPLPYLIEVGTPVRRTARATQGGTAGGGPASGRALAFPVPMSDDVWHNCVNGRRYRVGDVTVVAAVRSVPVIVTLTLGEIPPGHVIYDLELPE